MANFSNFYRNVRRNSRQQRKNTQTTETLGNRIMRSSGVGASVNPLTPTQKAEQERAKRMRQGISSVVRSSFNRQFSRPTYININTVNRLNQLNTMTTNPFAPVKRKQITGGNGVGEQRMFSKERSILNNTKFITGGQGVGNNDAILGRKKTSVLEPIRQDIKENYYDAVRKVGMKGSRNERKVYVPLSQRDENGQISTNQRRLENAARGGNRKAQVEAALARTKAQTLSGHTYDQYVNAELNKKGLLGQDYILRGKDPSKEAIDYRQRYGFDKEAYEAIKAIADNAPSGDDYIARFSGQNGSEIDRLKFGFDESWRARNIEDTYQREYGRTLDDDTQAKLDAVRDSGGYMVGNMLGQASQFAVTAPLSPLVEQGLMARMGLKGGRAAINTTKDAVKYAIARIGADQVVSAPVNMVDALKGEDTKDVALRFFYNTGLDILFGGLMEIPSLRTNSKFIKALRANDAANAMEEGAEQIAAKSAAERQLSEAISSFNPSEQRVIRNRMKELADDADARREIERGFAGESSADNLDIYNEQLPSDLTDYEARRIVDTEKTPTEIARERGEDFRTNSNKVFQNGGVVSHESVVASVRHGIRQENEYDWRVAYDAARRNGLTEEEAVRYADDALDNILNRANLRDRPATMANELRASGNKAMADATDMAAYKKMGEVPKEEIDLAQNEIRNANGVSDNATSNAMNPKTSAADYIPVENKGKVYNADEDVYVTRYDNEGADFSNKPQGLYVTHRSTPSVHADAGDIENHLVIDKNAKFYDTVFDGKLQTNRMPIPIECGTTVNYLVDKMGKGRVEQLLKTNRDDLIVEFGKEYPNVDWSRYYDNLEMVEAYGGLVARKDGIDVVRTIDKSATSDFDTTELSVLNDSVIREDADIPTGKREPIAEEPKQLYNEPRGDGNGAEKHQSTVERAGSGEEEVRANVGAVQNGERQAVGGTHLENSSNPASTGRTGSTLSLTDEQRAVMDAAGKTNANLREADYSAFSNALNEGKASNKYGSYVDPQDVDELTKKGAKTFLSDDGSVGFAITKDGDIIGAFNRGGKYRGAVDDMLITARLNGGTKLDCYGIGLVNKYEQAGYVPVAKIPFNPEYVNDPMLLANKPDVYVMMKNGDDIDTVIRKNANGEYHVSSPEELDALRTFDDYDEALEYRDNLLKNGGSPKAETAVEKTNVAEVSQKANTAPKNETAVEQTAKKAEQAQDKTWQEHAREDYKTGKQRAKAVEEGKIPSRENGEVVNAIKRLKETKDFSNVKDALNRGVKDGIYNRKIRHLDEEIDKAINEIEADPEKAINDVLDYHPNGAKANDVPADAIPWVMKGYALCKWADVNGMTALKEDIAATMAKAQSTGGSILRAGQVFTVMADPKTQRDIVLEYVEKMQEKYEKRLKGNKLNVPEDLLNKLDNATTDAEKSKILDDITVHVWNQVPQSFTDALGTLRITSMLANTTTMIRNIASNAGFLGVREVDKSVNTMMEATAEKLNKIDRAHRTHTFYNPLSKENRKIQAFWYSDYGKHRNIIKGQSRWDEGGGTLSLDLRPQEARHFGVKAGGGRKGGLIGVASAGLEGTRRATSWIMDTGDEAFIAPTYADAATQLMVVRGWKIEDLNPARMQEIRDYATDVAQKATYRDPSEFATALAKWGHWQKGDGALRLIRAVGVSGLQPFKKTPINIGKRSIEYSPIGFIKGVYDIRRAVKAGDSQAVNKAISELSKGTTGTGLVVAGYLLAEQGVINAQLPTDDEGYLRRDLGEQDYALNIGGKSRSLQWAAPGAIPILSGATLYDQVRQRGWNALIQPETLVQVLSESANPLLEMSFMQSYMDLLDSTDSVKGANKITIGALQIGLSYASQFIPTALGKVANVVDPVRRDTSSQAETPSGRVIQKAINKGLINKIPKWSESLPAYRDSFGNIQTTEDMKDRIIQNFVSPWYTKEIKTDDPVYKELFRINNATPDTNLIPTNSIGKGKHELSLNGEKINLDPHDMEEYKKIRGEGNQKALKFIDSDEYKSMSDTERAKALEDIYDNAKVDAKRQMLLKKGKSEWDVYTEGFEGAKADQIGAAKNAGIDPKDYNHTLTDKTADADGNGTVSKSEYYDYLLRQNQYNDKQRAVLMAAKNKSWDGKYNPFVTGEPPKDSQAAHAESTSYTDDIKSTGLSEKQFKEITSADTARIDSNGSGRVSQKEYQAYLDSFSYLTDEQKSALWKKYNPHWKKNPYDGSTASSGRSKRGRSGRRSSGGSSSKTKKREKTASEKRFAALQTGKAPTNAKGIEALSNGAKGLTKAQKKALVKLMQKKLEV